MSVSAIVHLVNEDPIVCELEEIPEPVAQVVILRNPRRRDGKELHYLEQDVTHMVIPWHRINFIQMLPSVGIEEVIGFVRE